MEPFPIKGKITMEKSMSFTQEEAIKYSVVDCCTRSEWKIGGEVKVNYYSKFYKIPDIIKQLKLAKVKVKTLVVFNDPGHGWLKVKKSELIKLGIADKISSCSYVRGEDVFLEEDMDASTYINAIKELYNNKVKFLYNSYYGNKQSRIRNYECYLYVVEGNRKLT